MYTNRIQIVSHGHIEQIGWSGDYVIVQVGILSLWNSKPKKQLYQFICFYYTTALLEMIRAYWL